MYQQDKKRSLFLAADQWNDAFLTPLTIFMQSMFLNASITCRLNIYSAHKVPGHALHEQGSQRLKKRRSTGQQPGTKSASCPGHALHERFP